MIRFASVTALVVVTALYVGGSAIDAQRDKPVAQARIDKEVVTIVDKSGQQCRCVPPPWQPDPPCVRTCSGLILRYASDTDLTRTVRLSPQLQKSIDDIKRGGTTDSQLDAFLKSPSAKEFVASVEKAPINDLKILVSEAQAKLALASTGGALRSARGELKGVDAAKMVLILASGETIQYDEQTKATGAQGGVAGLASMSGRQVTIEFTMKGIDRVATLIEISAK